MVSQASEAGLTNFGYRSRIHIPIRLTFRQGSAMSSIFQRFDRWLDNVFRNPAILRWDENHPLRKKLDTATAIRVIVVFVGLYVAWKAVTWTAKEVRAYSNRVAIVRNVEGTLKLDGKPVPHVIIILAPDPSQGTRGPSSQGHTDSAGRFRLLLNRTIPGAVLGSHRVTIRCIQYDSTPIMRGSPEPLPSSNDTNDTKPMGGQVPARYSDPATSDLRAEIKKDTKTLTFELTSP